MKKEEFKEFVKKNPKLISYVKSNEMSWQKFYELYDLYGEDENIWKDYLKPNEDVEKRVKTLSLLPQPNIPMNLELFSIRTNPLTKKSNKPTPKRCRNTPGYGAS